MHRFMIKVVVIYILFVCCSTQAPAADQPQSGVRKIYCAGPLFNAKEREEMEQITSALEKSGFRVFLPHRDGIQLAVMLDVFIANGIPRQKAVEILNKAIFYLDVYQVLDSDGLILNLNGRVPDEGSLVEAGIAWQAGKAIVIYKDDSRSLVDGNDNPLIMGLTGFRSLRNIQEIPKQFSLLFATHVPGKAPQLV